MLVVVSGAVAEGVASGLVGAGRALMLHGWKERESKKGERSSL